jgi:hypothetical protein
LTTPTGETETCRRVCSLRSFSTSCAIMCYQFCIYYNVSACDVKISKDLMINPLDPIEDLHVTSSMTLRRYFFAPRVTF